MSTLIQTLKILLTYPDSERARSLIIIRFISWQIYKRLIHRPLDISLFQDVKIRCYPDSSSASSVFYYGLYEHSMMSFLLSYLRADDTFLDIGANIGVYSLLASSRIKTGQIYSFEPIPKNYHRLKENIDINSIPNINPSMLALYSCKGSIDMNLLDGDCMPSITQNGSSDNTISVVTDTLNNIFADKSLNPSLCKLDAEGAELAILQGATHLLEKQSPPVWLLDYYTRDVADFLMSYEFDLFKYDVDKKSLNRIKDNPAEEHASVAISKSHLAQVSQRLLAK